MATQMPDTFSHISELAVMLGAPVDILKTGDGYRLDYLGHHPSLTALVSFAIEPDRYSLTVNVADGKDDLDRWGTICLAIVYAVQNRIPCKLEDCGEIMTLSARLSLRAHTSDEAD